MNPMPPSTDAAPEPREPSDADLLLPAGWPDVLDVAAPDRRVLAAIAAVAVLTDLAVRSQVAGLAGALLVVAVAGGLAASRRLVNRSAWPILLGAPVFGVWLAVRATEWLLFLDLVAAAGLLVLGASWARRGDPTDETIPGLAGRALHGAIHGLLAPGFVARGLRGHGSSGVAAVVRGMVLAVPVVVVIGLLFASADPVFASFFRFPTNTGDVVLHVFLLGLGGWGAAGLHRLASAAPYDVDTSARRPLGTIEAATILGGLVAVFAAFVASQVAGVLGGADYVRRTAGLSYADYARRGFFQLLAVATITLAVVLLVRAAVTHQDRRFVVLGEAVVVLDLLVVAGAVRRLGLYEQAYGLTLLRLWSVLFAVWLGGVFVLLGLTLAGVHRRRRWFVPAALALGLAGLLGLNVANPEARIVHRNVERFAGTDRLDVDALATLSDDAVPALVDALPRLSPAQREEALRVICGGDLERSGGPWAYNAGRAAAAEARARVCPRLSA